MPAPFIAGMSSRREVVVNGRADVVGADRRALEALIAREGTVKGPQIHLAKDDVTIDAGDGPSAQVWLVRYDPRIVQVPVARGENGGLTLPHRNVVKALVKLGAWDGKPVSYRLPAASDAMLRDAVLVQAGGGAILAAARN